MKAKTQRISFKIMLFVFVALLILSVGISSAYAFFTSDLYKSLTGQITANGNGIAMIDVSSFSDLWMYSVGSEEETIATSTEITGKYNDFSQVSKSTDRKILHLTSDITLDADLTITGDYHIDLGGKTLYLNGHDLAISHTYSGSVIISNGTIVVDEEIETSGETEGEEATAAQGKIYFDTPYSTPTVDTVVFATREGLTAGTTLEAADYALNVSKNTRVIAYHALKSAALKIVNYADIIPATVSYADLIAGTGTDFSTNLFLAEKLCAVSGESTAEVCAFVFDDLDLPLYIGAYKDVAISYSFANGYIDEYGKVTKSSDIENETLTITITKGGETIGSSTWTLHIVDPSNSTQATTAGQSILNAYMYRYYTNTAEEGAAANYTYELQRAIQLPKKVEFYSGNDVYSVSYAFAAYSDSALTNQVTGDDLITSLSDYAWLLQPTSAVRYLQATLTYGTSSTGTTKVYNVTASDAGLIRTDASYAQDFIVENYGGEIVITATKTGDTYSFSSYTLKTPESGNADSRILSVQYTLINDTNSLYALDGCDTALDRTATKDGTLYVQTGKNPLEYVQTVQLDCLFTLENSTVDLQIPVRCRVSEGDNANAFLPYYNYYNQMIFATTGSYTIQTFDMPFASGDGASDYVVCYDIAVETATKDADGNTTYTYEWNSVKGITIELYYNGTSHALTPTTGSSEPYTGYNTYVAALENYLSENSITLEEIIAYGDAKWMFTIDTSATSEIGDTDQDFCFVYNYRTIKGSTVFTRFADSSERLITTSFTLPGILKYSATTTGDGIINDASMYEWLGKVFGGDSYTDGGVILTDWLKQDKSVDVNDATYGTLLQSVTDFSGLQYLTGTTYVNLSGVDLSTNYEANIAAIAKMTALQKLNLSNCKLSNSGVSTTNPVDSALVGLTSLENLTTLWLGNEYGTTSNLNTIYSFEFLLDMPSLSSVYVYGNLDSTTVAGVFYGSEGLVNMGYFEELTSEGKSVYNTVSVTSALLFNQVSGSNDFKRLQNLEYQRKLKTGMSITTIYEQFESATVDDFGLATSYTVNGGNANVSGQSLSWGYEGDDPTTSTCFYVQYTLTVSGTTVTITVKFDVVRV